MDFPDNTPLPPKQAAREAGLSLAAFWRSVADGRLPAPCYPAPRTPRWFRSELRDALEKTRALPAAQKMARRAAKTIRQADVSALAGQRG